MPSLAKISTDSGAAGVFPPLSVADPSKAVAVVSASKLPVIDGLLRTWTELHVRGMRLEEALERVDKYIDDAAVLGVRSLRIVHGKGEGVLSGAIAKLLEESFLVASYGTARPEEGGWGVTTVEMAGQSKSSGGVS